MASADFLEPLSPRISLGQCRPCPFAPPSSTCAVYDSWASLVLACSPPVARLAARSCSYGRRFASGPFAWVPCGSHLAVRLRLSSSPRRGPFTPKGSAPARHTRPRAPTGRVFQQAAIHPVKKCPWMSNQPGSRVASDFPNRQAAASAGHRKPGRRAGEAALQTDGNAGHGKEEPSSGSTR
jgi:hypothetical protein